MLFTINTMMYYPSVIKYIDIGHTSGTVVLLSLYNQKIVVFSPGGALVLLDFPSVLSYQRQWRVVPCLWDIAQKRTLGVFRKE